MKQRFIVSFAIAVCAAVFVFGTLVGSLQPGQSSAAADNAAPAALSSLAQDAMDETLEATIQKLGLKPLSRPEPSPAPLFRLGEALFGDPLLSGNRNIACITCHQPELGTGDGLALSLGEGRHGDQRDVAQPRGIRLARNSPPLYNVGLGGFDRMFRDGRVAYDAPANTYTTPEPALNGKDPARSDITRALDGALSAQALFPLLDHAEMRGQPGDNELADAPDNQEAWRRIVKRLVSDDTYRLLLHRAYPELPSSRAINIGHVAKAIAAYIREAFVAVDTPYDRYLRGDKNALDVDAKRGMALFFGKARCVRCHKGPHLSDFGFHAVAVPQIGPNVAGQPSGQIDDRGVFPHVINDTRSLYHFKTAPLRNIGHTAPYMHDGALQTLREVVEHYNGPDKSIAKHCYGGRQLPNELKMDCDRFRNNLRLSMLPPSLRHPLGLTDDEITAIVAFLERGLTAVDTPHASPTRPDNQKRSRNHEN